MPKLCSFHITSAFSMISITLHPKLQLEYTFILDTVANCIIQTCFNVKISGSNMWSEQGEGDCREETRRAYKIPISA